MLCGSDITKRHAVTWGVTPEQAEPWLKERSRERLFREAVIGFLCGPEKEDPVEAYCRACRGVGDDDCANCDPSQIRVIDNDE